MATVRYIGTRAGVTRIARLIAGMLSGRVRDQQNIGQGFLLTLGFAALTDIKDAFIVKSRGGTDEMGIKWPPLSKEYLAYGRRFGPGERRRLKGAAGLGRSHSRGPGQTKGLLTPAQLRFWRYQYAQLLTRFLLSESEQQAKSHAAAIAWIRTKKMGGKTKLEVYGNRQVDILRDTGVLFNSLSPGLLSGSGNSISYTKPGQPGGEQQIFEIEPGAVIVGTNVAYASAHQHGRRGLLGFGSARPFLPDDKHPVPTVWWDRWLELVNKAFVVSVELFYRQAA